MDLQDRTRRTALVCLHCLRSIAFYRAGFRAGRIRNDDQFWVAANGAFLDSAVLEWSKAFADRKGEHYWRRIVDDSEQPAFYAGLLVAVGMSEAAYDDYIISVRRYRDKFVAHLDTNLIMYIPRIRAARKSAKYLLESLRNSPRLGAFLPDAPPPERFYGYLYRRAFMEYKPRD